MSGKNGYRGSFGVKVLIIYIVVSIEYNFVCATGRVCRLWTGSSGAAHLTPPLGSQDPPQPPKGPRAGHSGGLPGGSGSPPAAHLGSWRGVKNPSLGPHLTHLTSHLAAHLTSRGSRRLEPPP
jgi:hypothetical protein